MSGFKEFTVEGLGFRADSESLLQKRFRVQGFPCLWGFLETWVLLNPKP